MKIKLYRHRATIGAAVAILMVLPLVLSCEAAGLDNSGSGDAGDAALIQQVMRLVQQRYVEPVKPDELTDDALKGMLSSLDPHSDYMDATEYQTMQSDLRGKFGGIGIELTLQNGRPQVISPIDGTPAAEAGMEPGDVIAKINGRPTIGLSLQEIVTTLRGTPGSSVNLEITRANHAPIDVTLTRRIINVVTVKSHLEGRGIGYVRISTFGERTQSEFVDAVSALKRRANGNLTGLVLDLRNDPGGLLEAAVDISSDFLDGGTVVTTRGRLSGDNHAFDVTSRSDRLEGVPVVVLINSASASAAEIVTGALQDHHRATVMGTRSFGKGSVQTIIPLGDRGAVRLTTARYYTPSGHSIQDQGIVPDIIVGVPKDEQVANATVLREVDLAHALRNTGSLDNSHPGPEGSKAGGTSEGSDVPINPALIGTERDSQLQAAIRYLEGNATTRPGRQGG
ncbi:MAG TPA: S41 family peptidase [Stellaceae bacterium]|nr:S41 family peptidase [Stellaceae bacterium]